MGYFYPPPPTFVGGKQPYAPPLGLVQSGPVPQAPPLRGAMALATFNVILAAWQPPFFEAQGAGDIAPIIQAPAAVSQPPVSSRINFDTVRRAWEPPFLVVQGAGAIAPNLPAAPAGSQPPALSRANTAIVLAAWQVDPTIVISLASIGSQTIAAVQPPVSGVNLQTVVQSWAPPYFSAQGAGNIAPSLPIISQPPPISGVNLRIIQSGWDAPFFMAQGAGEIASSLPLISQPQPLSWAQFNSIRAAWELPWSAVYMQGAGDVAPNIPVAAGAAPPPLPGSVNFETILQSWIPAFMPPPRQQGIATQPVVNAPPVNTDSLFYELIAANQPPPYALQKAGTVASWLPPAGAPSQPQPVSAVTLNVILRAWDPPVWWPLPANGPTAQTATVVNAPPPSSGVVFDQLISLNQPPPYALPKAGSVASWLPAVGAPSQPTPVGAATLNLIIRAWDPPVWWPLPDNGPIAQTATVVNAPPASNAAQMLALVSASQPPFVLPPVGDDFAPLVPGPSTPAPLPNLALGRLLVQSWDVPAPTFVPRAQPTRSGPLPDPPPPSSRVNLQTIVQLHQPPWNYGQGFGFIAPYPVYVPLVLAGSPRYVVHHLRARRFTVSAVTYLQFEPLDPAEAVELIFDFSPDLPSGIIVSGPPQISVILLTGVDATPGNIRNGTAGVDATFARVIVPVKGALDGNKYAVKVVQTTTDPELVLALTGILQMVEGA